MAVIWVEVGLWVKRLTVNTVKAISSLIFIIGNITKPTIL